MLSDNKRLRAIRSALYSSYLDFRTTYGVFCGIMTGFLISTFFIHYFSGSGSSQTNSSSLNSGLFTGIITMIIFMIVITSNSELIRKFSFPMDRSTLALSHALLIFTTPLILLLTSCVFYGAEYLLAVAAQTFRPSFVFRFVITKESFLLGFASSFFTMVSVAAVTYCLFMYFFRYKVVSSIVGGLAFLSAIFVEDMGKGILQIVDDIFFRSAPALQFLRLLGITAVALVLAFIPLKRMEVKK